MAPLIIIPSIFLVAILIGVQYIIAKYFESLVSDNGYAETTHVFHMCFWLGIVGYLYVIALLHQCQLKNHERIISFLSKSTTSIASEEAEFNMKHEGNINIAPVLQDEFDAEFKELLDAGYITQEEFDAKKKQLLGL